MTAYDGLDVCGGNDWRVDDVPNTVATYEDDSNAPRGVYQILTRLKPNTQYAFYVKTYSLTTASHYGGQSPIQYFTTLPSRPSPPVKLRATSNHYSDLLVQWGPPVYPNGNLSHYLVVGQWIPDDQAFLLEQRDYCQHPMTREGDSHVTSSKPVPNHQPCCKQHGRLAPVPPALGQNNGAGAQTDDCIARCSGLVMVSAPNNRVLIIKNNCTYFCYNIYKNSFIFIYNYLFLYQQYKLYITLKESSQVKIKIMAVLIAHYKKIKNIYLT
jgi:hypothetical protein